MTVSRLLRASRPSCGHVNSSPRSVSYMISTVKCIDSKADWAGSVSDNNINNKMASPGEKWKSTVAVKAIAATSSRELVSAAPQVDGGLDLASWVGDVRDALLKISVFRHAVKRKTSKSQVQMLIEKGIINCRFFTLFAVVGSLFGSALCFLEGFFLVLESYFQYYSEESQSSDQGYMVHLVEAIDMFLVGTSTFMFGIGVYTMFIGLKNSKDKVPYLPGSNLFGLFHLKSLPSWVDLQCVTQAKSRIGHAVMLLLQAGVLEKFKDIPLVTSLDLACFAGAVFVSSACIFLLSRLSFGGIKHS